MLRADSVSSSAVNARAPTLSISSALYPGTKNPGHHSLYVYGSPFSRIVCPNDPQFPQILWSTAENSSNTT